MGGLFSPYFCNFLSSEHAKLLRHRTRYLEGIPARDGKVFIITLSSSAICEFKGHSLLCTFEDVSIKIFSV